MKNNYESEKIERWTKGNIAKNVFVYLANFIIVLGIYFFSAYMNMKNGGGSFANFIKDYNHPLGFVVALFLLFAITFIYLFYEDRNFLRRAENSEMIFLIMEIALIICVIIGNYLDTYLRPLALVSVLLLFLINRRIAIFLSGIFNVIVLLIDVFSVSAVSSAAYSSFITGFISSIIIAFVTFKVYSRFQLLVRSLSVSIPALIMALLSVVESGGANWRQLIYALSSGVLAVSIFMLLLPIFEFVFKKISAFKLAELTDHKSKLIRRLITEAPGTFNHSIVVSNLAEACATAIDEDALLARTCAYYHDIGKLRRPEYFSENQSERTNPHDGLTPELSTNIIKAHALDGYHLALKYGLPQEIADVCLEHHGTLPIWFFYDKAKKFTDGEVNIKDYCYAGPKPHSKIAAIIMIADGCEAAARALKDRSREKVEEVVRNLVKQRIELGQFDECEITLKELNIIIHVIVNNLSGVYHERIEYPQLDLEKIEKKDVN